MDVTSSGAKGDIAKYSKKFLKYAGPETLWVVCGANTQNPLVRACSREELESEARSRGLRYFEVNELLESGGVEEMFQDLLYSITHAHSVKENDNA